MYVVTLNKITNGQQSNEEILATEDKQEAELAFAGTLLGLRYEYKEKHTGEFIIKDKVKIKFDKTIITLTLKRR